MANWEKDDWKEEQARETLRRKQGIELSDRLQKLLKRSPDAMTYSFGRKAFCIDDVQVWLTDDDVQFLLKD